MDNPNPFVLDTLVARPLRLSILMVTDGSAGYGNGIFSLDQVVSTLTANFAPGVQFHITKAHRQTDFTASAPADVVNGFRFTAEALAHVDEVWLFGVAHTGIDPLSDNELKELATFMDNGGGVFATGDHEDLGNAMCARIPRVRSMRKWYFPETGPNGEPPAPEALGTNRFDTLRVGLDAGYQFTDQSDVVPQQIQPRYYGLLHQYPHPLLCGRTGVIDILPDHMHEGECYVDADLSRSFTFAGYTTQEYRTTGDGFLVRPEVIAQARVIGGHATATDGSGIGDSNIVNERTFGVAGAYDGHRVDVGRVAVDSTWHHFFRINIHGDPLATGAKQSGFFATPEGLEAYGRIQEYYRNIAFWLLSPHRQQQVLAAMAHWLRWQYPFVEELTTVRRFNYDTIRYLGGSARDVLGRVAPQCRVEGWVIAALSAVALAHPKLIDIVSQLDPWNPRPPKEAAIATLLGRRKLSTALLGGIVLGIATEYRQREDVDVEKEAPRILSVITKSVEKALLVVSDALLEETRVVESFATQVRQMA